MKSYITGLMQCRARGRHSVDVGWLPSFFGNIVCGIPTLGRKLGTVGSSHILTFWDTKVFRVLFFCFSFCDSFVLFQNWGIFFFQKPFFFFKESNLCHCYIRTSGGPKAFALRTFPHCAQRWFPWQRFQLYETVLSHVMRALSDNTEDPVHPRFLSYFVLDCCLYVIENALMSVEWVCLFWKMFFQLCVL